METAPSAHTSQRTPAVILPPAPKLRCVASSVESPSSAQYAVPLNQQNSTVQWSLSQSLSGKPLTAAAQFASASASSPRLVRYHLPAVKWSASGGTAGNRQQNHHHNSGTPDLRIGRVVGRTGNPCQHLRHSRVTTCLQHHQKHGERGT